MGIRTTPRKTPLNNPWMEIPLHIPVLSIFHPNPACEHRDVQVEWPRAALKDLRKIVEIAGKSQLWWTRWLWICLRFRGKSPNLMVRKIVFLTISWPLINCGIPNFQIDPCRISPPGGALHQGSGMFSWAGRPGSILHRSCQLTSHASSGRLGFHVGAQLF